MWFGCNIAVIRFWSEPDASRSAISLRLPFGCRVPVVLRYGDDMAVIAFGRVPAVMCL